MYSRWSFAFYALVTFALWAVPRFIFGLEKDNADGMFRVFCILVLYDLSKTVDRTRAQVRLPSDPSDPSTRGD